MKLTFSGEMNFLEKGIQQLAPQLGIEITIDGLPINVQKTEERKLEVRLEHHKGTIMYCDTIHFFRALALFIENARQEKTFHIMENPHFSMNGVMFDCSRNAVMKVETACSFIRYMAVMGLNMMMLYTEDTYTIEDEPYFGYMRGRYTAEELKTIDDYAYMFGIEVIPCIQTLAHLSTYLKWSHASSIRDTEDVLLVGHEETYIFIEKMIVAASKPFRSRRIHIGMDEAHGLGRGQYLDLHGKKERYALMTDHLKRVRGLTEKHGLKPMIWSDMYFRVWSKNDAYYDLDIEIPQDEADKVPKDVQMVYWDYYNEDQKFYEQYLEKHIAFGQLPVFAGGIWTWHGLTIHYKKTFNTTHSVLKACKQKGVQEVFATLWRDNGAEGNFYLALLGMQLFAEHGYATEVSDSLLKKRFEFCTGGTYDAFLAMGKIDVHPEANIHRLIPDSPAKFLLWQDILVGLFDQHIAGLEFPQHFNRVEQEIRAYTVHPSKWNHLYSLMAEVCRVLALKSELGLQITDHYQQNRKEALKGIADNELKQLEEAVKQLRNSHRKEWFANYKAFGWEILDIRYGGLLARIDTTRERLLAYEKGDLGKIEELEEEKLTYDSFSRGKDGGVGKENRYQRIVSANPL